MTKATVTENRTEWLDRYARFLAKEVGDSLVKIELYTKSNSLYLLAAIIEAFALDDVNCKIDVGRRRYIAPLSMSASESRLRLPLVIAAFGLAYFRHCVD